MRLIRVAYIKHGTFGVLLDDDYSPFCVTLERPWRDNKCSISCIPIGAYECRRVSSPRFGNTFKVADVKGRSHILFHKGNLMEDTHGCIILGEEYGVLGDEIAVLSSGRAFAEFKHKLRDVNEFQLEIKNGIL